MAVRLEDKIQVIRWKLGLPASGENPAELQRTFEEMQKNPAEFKQMIEAASTKLGHLLAAAIRAKLTGEASQNYDWAKGLEDLFVNWAKQNERLVSPKLSGELRKALDTKPPVPVVKPTPTPGPAPRQTQQAGNQRQQGLHPNAGMPPPAPPPIMIPPQRSKHGNETPPPLPQQPPPLPVPPPLPQDVPEAVVSDPEYDLDMNVSDPQSPGSPSPTSMWNYKPLPHDPDPHAEFDTRAMENPPSGFKVFGARVRGKKHKHDGTNCDDWFEFAQAGPWTIIAVSDGAGSYKFSRVGAKASCEAAVKALSENLIHHHMKPRETVEEWAAAQSRNADWTFASEDIEQIQKYLHRAVRKAYQAVEAAFQERKGSHEHEACLPPNRRPLDVKEFSSTLLLAVHRTVTFLGKDYSFVMACQVGDGMTGAIHQRGEAVPLGAADSGGYSGETEFLTSSGKIDPRFLTTKTVSFLNPMQALLVMTDGVADDYFPGVDHLGRLWADLVVNKIPDHVGPTDRDMENAISGSPLPTLDDVRAAEVGAASEIIDGQNPRNVIYLKSAETFAEKLGTTVDALLKQPAALVAGTLASGSIPGATPEERLRLWLDAYHVRGSFDDRTLVVMHREALP